MVYNFEVSHDLTENRFRLLLFVFRLGGIPVNIKNASGIWPIYYSVLSFCNFSVFLATISDIVVHFDDLQQAMKPIRLVSNMVVIIWTQLYVRFHKTAIDHLLHLTESFIWEDLPIRDPNTGHLSMAGWIKRINRLTRNMCLISAGFHSIQSTIRIITSRELIYSTWYPFDISASPTYELLIISQIIATAQHFSMFFGFPYLYVTLVCVACSQLGKLRTNLLDIKHVTMEENVDTRNDSGESMLTLSQEKLNECIRQHQEIIRFLMALEDTMNIPICGIFLLTLMGMCVVAFSVITSWGDLTDVSQALFVYLLIAGEMFLYCQFGTILTQEHESVAEAAWASDWVGASVTYQRNILFIIAKANKKFALTAGKFLDVSNVTMMSILNESISLFMFLLTMKDKSEEIHNNN